MPAKRKPKPAPEPHFVERSVAMARRHPRWSLAAVIGIAVGLVTLATAAGQLLLWTLGFIETTSQAKELASTLRSETATKASELDTKISLLRTDFETFRANTLRGMAWSSTTIMGLQVTTLRNRAIIYLTKAE